MKSTACGEPTASKIPDAVVAALSEPGLCKLATKTTATYTAVNFAAACIKPTLHASR